MNTKEQIKEHITYLLKNYHQLKRDIEVLQFDLQHFQGVSPEDVIDSLSFAKGEGDGGSSGSISDKTARIAAVYKELTEEASNQTKEELLGELYRKQTALKRLDYCISRLDERQKNILRDLYIQRLPWTRICAKYYVSQTMIAKYRKKAIHELTKMYEICKAG